MEPELLRRGKEFHRLVQADWAGEIEKATVRLEHSIRFIAALRSSKRRRRGRLDIFIDQIDDFVTVVEIKATDWDHISSNNLRKLLATHRRQVMRYVEKFLDDDHVSVCAGIIYPKAPDNKDVKAQVESYLNDHALQVVWYADS
ncbi:MAG: hypothetical protein ABI779_05205 [Acidobacteriota bacterium]